MVARLWVVVVLAGALGSLGAQARTKNFVVDIAGASPETAQRIGEWAEHYRKQKAIDWLGQEMPAWGVACPLQVSVRYDGSSGATSFTFDKGSILTIDMKINGAMDRLIASVLPHEVTHTVFAYRFRQPVPRWADEGGAVLSEDDQERSRHDALVRQILNAPGRAIPLSRLFTLKDYPRDVMVLYAEGYSVTNFLVNKSGRPAFLAFVGDGMQFGWDQAVQKHYHYRNVNELEQAWIQYLRDNPRSPTAIASAGGHRPAVDGGSSYPGGNQVVVRQTLPPAFPVLGAPRPVARGAMPSGPDEGARAMTPGSWAPPSAAPASGTPFMGSPPTELTSPVRIKTPRMIDGSSTWGNPATDAPGYQPR
jgi:hypothetical protein